MIIEVLVTFVLLLLVASILIWPIAIYHKLDRIEARLRDVKLVALVDDGPEDDPSEDDVEQPPENVFAIGRVAA